MGCQSDKLFNNQPTSCFSNKSVALPFENKITDDSLSVFDYHYLYNGGGVGIADFNNDGLKDIFLGGNMVSSSLLISEGNLKFKDITETAGVKTKDWINGISIVDINHDGKMDIYLSVGGPYCKTKECKNLLFINESSKNSVSFSEQGQKFNLDIEHYSQQALFFDADLDGDLDMYQLQNYVDPQTKNYPKPKNYYSPKSKDKFFLNQEVESGEIKFVDASKEWNINASGFGLGIATADLNDDGYSDLYIANDFISDDIIYLNEGGKRFIDKSKELLKHTSHNSMGVDLEDFNGDLLDDILVVDMLPYKNERQKTMLGSMNFDKFLLSRKEDYNNQFIRNTFQLNGGTIEESLLPFSDVAPYFGVHETDWSWSPLIADFDNDGDKDIYISNGYGKNITDLDFVNFNSNIVGFGNKENLVSQIKEDVKKLPSVELPNHFFLNDGKGKFTNIKAMKSTITNGVAYADLDNDGDLDLVENNINTKSEIQVNESNGNFIKINLEYNQFNPYGLGSQILVITKNNKKYKSTVNPVRSYLSTMDTEKIIGLGSDSVVSVIIRWPNNTSQKFDNLKTNQSIKLKYEKALCKTQQENPKSTNLLIEHSDTIKHRLAPISKIHDFSIQPLLFKSCLSAHLRMNKINDDEYLIANLEKHLLLWNKSTNNSEQVLKLEDYIVSDMFVKNINKDEDQFFVSMASNSSKWDNQLVIVNKNRNEYVVKTIDLPKNIYKIYPSTEAIWLYGAAQADSYPNINGHTLYKLNKINNLYTLEKQEIESINGIKSMQFIDLDGDKKEELITVNEWDVPKIFRLKENKFVRINNTQTDNLKGFWQTVKLADLDNDGDQDLILGNLGTNSRLKADNTRPLRIVKTDLDNNKKVDPIMSYFIEEDNEDYTYSSRDDITKVVPKIKKTYQSYTDFAQANFMDVVSISDSKVEFSEINTLESIILENKGNMQFKKTVLPREAQYSLINNFIVKDVNNDNLKDIIVLSNFDQVEVHNGSLDSSNGLILINKGDFNFQTMNSSDSGFFISEPVHDILEDEKNNFFITTNTSIYKFKANF